MTRKFIIQEKEGVIVAKAGGISESGTLKALKKNIQHLFMEQLMLDNLLLLMR